MKSLIKIFNKVMCKVCWGLGTKETGNDTISCPACKGKGYL